MGEVLQFPAKPRVVWPMDRVLDSFGFPVADYYDELPCDVEPIPMTQTEEPSDG